MPKMTKAQARRRLTEAASKVGNVWNGADATWKMTPKDFNELVAIRSRLLKLSEKLR